MMNKQILFDEFIQNPVIAAVRDSEQLERALAGRAGTIFLLAGTINELDQSCRRINESMRRCFLHVDLIEGLRPDQQGIRFVAEQLQPTGIITTKPACVKWARGFGLFSVQRIFMLDSTAVQDGLRHIEACNPDLVEIMPGVSEKALQLAARYFHRPLIAGGLVSSREEVYAALAAGALAVSTSCAELWNLR